MTNIVITINETPEGCYSYGVYRNGQTLAQGDLESLGTSNQMRVHADGDKAAWDQVTDMVLMREFDQPPQQWLRAATSGTVQVTRLPQDEAARLIASIEAELKVAARKLYAALYKQGGDCGQQPK